MTVNRDVQNNQPIVEDSRHSDMEDYGDALNALFHIENENPVTTRQNNAVHWDSDDDPSELSNHSTPERNRSAYLSQMPAYPFGSSIPMYVDYNVPLVEVSSNTPPTSEDHNDDEEVEETKPTKKEDEKSDDSDDSS